MQVTKKNKTQKAVKNSPKGIITKGRGIVSPEDTLFPEQLARANYILSRTQFSKDTNNPDIINVFE